MQGSGAAAAQGVAHGLNDRVEAALALRANGQFAEALELLSLPGEYAQDVYTLRGDLQLELGRVHEALGSYSTVIALDRRNIYAHQKLAVCLRQLERWEPAVETLRKILDQDSYSDSARIGLGDCLLHMNRPEEALACFEACWSEGAILPCLFGKAVALQLLRRYEESEAAYQRFLDLKPDSEEALCNLIAASMEQFALARVQRYALQLIGKRPESVIALQALVVTAFERREFESAAEYYGRLLDATPEGRLASGGDSGAVQYRLSRRDAERLQHHDPSRWPGTRSH